MMCTLFTCSLTVRSIYQKFRDVDLLDKKKTVTASKPGEDRACLLGLGMILSSVMMYFVLGITTLRAYTDRYRPVGRIVFFLYVQYFYFLSEIGFIQQIQIMSLFFQLKIAKIINMQTLTTCILSQVFSHHEISKNYLFALNWVSI